MTVVSGKWFPATVLLPDGQTWRRVFIVAAKGGDHAGLHIWRKPDYVAEWQAAIDWQLTVIPAPWKARAGFSVHTDQGLVVITPNSGCSCGALARWPGPPWASTVLAGTR